MRFCDAATSLIGVFRALVEALNTVSTNWMALACITVSRSRA
jgi:hypothetical protein